MIYEVINLGQLAYPAKLTECIDIVGGKATDCLAGMCRKAHSGTPNSTNSHMPSLYSLLTLP